LKKHPLHPLRGHLPIKREDKRKEGLGSISVPGPRAGVQLLEKPFIRHKELDPPVKPEGGVGREPVVW